jgi:hypothetical protein
MRIARTATQPADRHLMTEEDQGLQRTQSERTEAACADVELTKWFRISTRTPARSMSVVANARCQPA